MNKCHWHSPMRKQLRRAVGILNAICQPSPSTTWMHQKYIYELNISRSKIYLWAKYIYEQNISISKIYIEQKYEPWLLVCYIWVTEVSTTWMHILFCILWHNESTNLPAFFYLTFPWNHTLAIESYHLEVISFNAYQTIMLTVQSLWHLIFKGGRGVY